MRQIRYPEKQFCVGFVDANHHNARGRLAGEVVVKNDWIAQYAVMGDAVPGDFSVAPQAVRSDDLECDKRTSAQSCHRLAGFCGILAPLPGVDIAATLTLQMAYAICGTRIIIMFFVWS